MSKRGLIGVLAGTLAVVTLVGASIATAAKPTMVRIEIDESEPDDFLTDACGVDVTTHTKGHIIIRTFTDNPRIVGLNTINLALTATAGENTYRFRDVGADLLRVTPDGTLILQIIGQLPFEFTGVLKIDLGTGEAILEPHHTTEDEVETACEVLTG